jgi:predicted DNA-binding protein (MmcQ/YjbR family)
MRPLANVRTEGSHSHVESAQPLAVLGADQPRPRMNQSGSAVVVAGNERIIPMDSMSRLEQIVARLPEATRVDVEEWGGHPTFRVRGKNFVFSDQTAERMTLKLPLAEAEAVVATDANASPAGYGLGRHGWVTLTVHPDECKDRWEQIEEWICISYSLVAPKALVRQLPDIASH